MSGAGASADCMSGRRDVVKKKLQNIENKQGETQNIENVCLLKSNSLGSGFASVCG
jgi:hypothetical protein